VPGEAAKELRETYMVQESTEESTKGLQGLIETLATLQRRTQEELTEIVNKDPSSTKDIVEDTYGEETGEVEEAEKSPPKKKKKGGGSKS